MSEINCIVLFNNSDQFEITMDSQVTFAMLNDQIRKNFQLADNVFLKFSYLDNEDDTIQISSEVEFKEFLEYSANLEFTTLLVTSEHPKRSDPIPEVPVISPSIIEEKVPQNDVKEENNEQNFRIQNQIPLRRQRGCFVDNKNVPKALHGGLRRPRVICDNCKVELQDIRFKCLQCPDFDLCDKCEDLKCKSNDNQIHPEDHIFAKIPSPIHRQVPNFPKVSHQSRPHPRHFSHPHYHSHPHPQFSPKIFSTLLKQENIAQNEDNINNVNDNNVNGNNVDGNNVNVQKENSCSERRKFWGQKWQQRGEQIKELENRVQLLEQEISQILTTVRNNSSNNNNNDDRKYWAFQS